MKTKPPIRRDAILAVLNACDGPIGMTQPEIAEKLPEVGRNCLSSTLGQMVRAGYCFAVGLVQTRRYFPTAEKLAAAQEPLAEIEAARKERYRQKKRMQERERVRKLMADPVKRAARLERQRLARQRDPQSRKKWREAYARKAKLPKPPKHIVVKESNPNRRQRVAAKKPAPVSTWKDLPVVIPPDVKVQVIPGFTGDRWQVKPPADGFHSEWLSKRSQG